MSTPNYVRALLEHLRNTHADEGLHHVEVRHDDRCPVFRDGRCNCEPMLESGARIDRKYRPRRRGQR